MNKKPDDASSPNGKEKYEVADVFRLYGQDYRLNKSIKSPNQAIQDSYTLIHGLSIKMKTKRKHRPKFL